MFYDILFYIKYYKEIFIIYNCVYYIHTFYTYTKYGYKVCKYISGCNKEKIRMNDDWIVI